ncbi:heparan-alpha-glucosaminide N-acetyltransferase domain-containing protein [Zhihengliuella flava]|uniref:Membrane protein n=1 Tax=Zhihengliuella flava TaxID=1285193 RepID=A0A931D7E5_9MICC|nr:heparan-alpha-glucosaminide N-acetyltransferase domain-containing protein [Zhihengliuella flava]MBG6083782.1 putative membrane protein [Zhihengliuella flava]
MSALSRTGQPRIAGVDAARGLALLGMMATHIVPLAAVNATGDDEPTWAATYFAGTASALFAVLAGASLAFVARSKAPHAVSRSVALRALMITAIGLACGMLDTNVAVILTHYGLLFLAVIPFLWVRTSHLLMWAVGWLCLSPVVLYVAVPWVTRWVHPADVGGSPTFTDLTRPATLVADLLFTGYYPVVVWVGFLLLGLWVGRLNVQRPPLALALLLGGAVVSAGARALSAALLTPAGRAELAAAQGISLEQLDLGLSTGYYFGPVVQSGWWFALSAPHTSAPLDVLHVAGTAVAAIGACQLLALGLAALLGRYGEALLWPLSGAGSITLTLYVAHLVALDALASVTASLPRVELYLWFAALSALAGIVVKFCGIRGPLEALIRAVARPTT